VAPGTVGVGVTVAPPADLRLLTDKEFHSQRLLQLVNARIQ
jgi:hypothetical protein